MKIGIKKISNCMFNNDNNTTPFTIEETEDLTPRIRCLSDNVHQLQSPYASSIHPPITPTIILNSNHTVGGRQHPRPWLFPHS